MLNPLRSEEEAFRFVIGALAYFGAIGGAGAAAAERLERSLQRLKEGGVDASGVVGDGDPVQAMEDALRTFGADEIVISTHPEGRSHWLERGVVTTARERFAVPITHVVVDLEAEREEVR